MATGIGRSRVGTYHEGYEHAGSIQGGAYCNSRLNLRIAKASEIERALASMFCEKCFPNGKPE